MSFLEVTLKCGRVIRSDCFLVANSTRPALAYSATERANKRFVEMAMEDAHKIFSTVLPLIVVPPRLEIEAEQKHLPSVRIVAEFNSRPIDEANTSSSAVVIWFQNNHQPIAADFLEDIQNIDWNGKAKDFGDP